MKILHLLMSGACLSVDVWMKILHLLMSGACLSVDAWMRILFNGPQNVYFYTV
jgi:hypothetical protein